MSAPISVITIVRNDAAGLLATASSVLAQSVQLFEYIVVDGSDQPGTDALHPWLVAQGALVLSGPDSGVYDAMTKGVAAARGRSVVFMNAGDLFRDGQVLKDLHDCLHASGMRWAYCLAQVERQGIRWRKSVGLVPYSTWRHAYSRAAICHQAVLMNRDLFFEVGGFRTDFGLQADVALLLAAGLRTPPAVLPRVGVRYDSSGLSSHHVIRALANKSRIRQELLDYGATAKTLDRLFTGFQILYVMARRVLAPLKKMVRTNFNAHRTLYSQYGANFSSED